MAHLEHVADVDIAALPLTVRTLGSFQAWRGGVRLPDDVWGREKAVDQFHYFLSHATVLDKVSEAVDKGATLPQQFGYALSKAWDVSRDADEAKSETIILEVKIDKLSSQVITLTEAIGTFQAEIASLKARNK